MSVQRIEPAPSADPLIGMRIAGRYRIERVHERGGSSVVYAATHEAQQREVAIKMLDEERARDPRFVERFMHEARTASSLSHGHVVGVSDFGQLPSGRPYLVMPMIMGKDLATLVSEQGPLPAKRVAALLAGVASALDSMHEKGLVHRDIKSENLMYVRGDDGKETAFVLDFGIAAQRAAGSEDDEGTSGTPEFMAPEALAGGVEDHRVDVYSLATVAFELLSGGLPFDGNDLSDLSRKKSTQKPRTLAEVGRAIFSPALEAVLARGLAKNPSERPSSAGKLVQELSAAAALTPSIAPAPPALAAPAPLGLPPQRRSARHRTIVGLPFEAQALPPEREPSIIIDPMLMAAARAEAPTPAAPPPAQPHSLSPVARAPSDELELEAPRRSMRTPAVLALAAMCVVALSFFYGRRSDKRAEQPVKAVAAPAPVAPVTPVAAPAPPAPEPEPEPVAAPEPVAPAPAAAPEPVVAEAAPVPAAPAIDPVPARTPRGSRPRAAVRAQSEPRESADSARARAQALTQEAVNAMLRGDFASAQQKLQEATDASPRFAPAVRSKGLLFERMERPKDAAKAFKQYLRLQPNAADAAKIRARLADLE